MGGQFCGFKRLLQIIAAVSLLTAPLVYAKDPVVSSAVYKAVVNAEKQLEKSAFSKALKPLKNLLAETDPESYDQAVLWKTIGAIQAAQGKYQTAAVSLEKSLSSKKLPDQQKQDVQYNLGQVYLANNQYKKALQALQPWIASNQKPTANDYLLLTQLYARLNQYQTALTYAEKLLKASKNPPESHYQLALSLYFELKHYKKAIRILETLIRQFPDNKTYWQQLAASYQLTGDYIKTTAIKDLAYRSSVLNSAEDALQLADLYSYTGAPYLAAQLLEKEMKAGKITKSGKILTRLSDTWLQAREYDKAADVLSKVAKNSQNGRLFERLGALYYEQQSWANAEHAYRNAIKKGGLKKPGNTWLLYGICAKENKQTKLARQAFSKALNYSYSAKSAHQWLQLLKDS